MKAENPDLQLYFVTLTVKDGESLQERFNHLVKAERSYKRQGVCLGWSTIRWAAARGREVTKKWQMTTSDGLPYMLMLYNYRKAQVLLLNNGRCASTN